VTFGNDQFAAHSHVAAGLSWQRGRIAKGACFLEFFIGRLARNSEKPGLFDDSPKNPSHGTIKNAELIEFITSAAPGMVA
jgi:hypothetical protein